MEQLEKVDSTIEQLEYYQHDQCDVLIIRLLLLSLMNRSGKSRTIRERFWYSQVFKIAVLASREFLTFPLPDWPIFRIMDF